MDLFKSNQPDGAIGASPAAQSQQPGDGRKYKMMVVPPAGPASPNAGFTGQQKQQKVPAVQKDRYLGYTGGGGGTKPKPKPKEDCMSCAD